MLRTFLRVTRSLAFCIAALMASLPMAFVIFGEADRLIYGRCLVGDQLDTIASPLSDFVQIVGYLYFIGMGVTGCAAAFTNDLRRRYNLAFWSGLLLLSLICFSALHDFLAGASQELGGGIGSHAEHGVLLIRLPVALIYSWSTFVALLVMIYAIRIPYERKGT